MTRLDARSVTPGVPSAATSRAMSMKRRDCSGLSALEGGSGFCGMGRRIAWGRSPL
jgi:hypothetical protein